jgi:tetratricopeptide (TPR) repeat protein
VTRWKGIFPGVSFVVALLVAPVLAQGQESTTRPPTATKALEGGKQDGVKPPDSRMQAEAYYELGVMYHERVFESLDLAIAEYEKAVKAHSDYAEAHYNLALSYHTKAKLGTDDKALYRKAVAEYKLYLKFSPQGELADKAKQNIRALEARLRQ